VWYVLTNLSEEQAVSIIIYEYGGSRFFRNVCTQTTDYTATVHEDLTINLFLDFTDRKFHVTMTRTPPVVEYKSECVCRSGETAATEMQNGVDLHGKASNLKT
jgi:hypothetical protein